MYFIANQYNEPERYILISHKDTKLPFISIHTDSLLIIQYGHVTSGEVKGALKSAEHHHVRLPNKVGEGVVQVGTLHRSALRCCPH
jgi:hypothetical protein